MCTSITEKSCSSFINIIIVDFNTIEKTLAYIRDCTSKISGCDFGFTIVDNAENKNSYNFILDSFTMIYEGMVDGKIVKSFYMNGKKINYIYNGINVGYGRGNNIGFLISKKIQDFEYFIISNNDLILPTDLDLAYYIDIFKSSHHIGVIGPRIIGLKNESQSPYKRRNIWQVYIFYGIIWPLNKFIKRLNEYCSELDQNKSSHFCYWVQGSFLVISSKAFQEAGLFDEKTFLYCEEMILAERMRAAAKFMYFDNKYTLIHNHGESTKKYFNFFYRERLGFKSKIYYFEKYRHTHKVAILFAKMFFELYLIKKHIHFKVRNDGV